jgi:hypothetical protein
MRRWHHTGQDIFVGDELRWERGSVIHDERRRTLVVKAREGTTRTLAVRLSLSDVEATDSQLVGKDRHRTFTGTDAEGEFFIVTIVRPDCGCSG